jgi:hypothetical protein
MIHFKVIGWLWLVLGILGSLYTCWHLAMLFRTLYFGGPLEHLVDDISAACFLTLLSALAGFGLLRHWNWARFTILVLGSSLLACSAIDCLFIKVNALSGMAAGFSLYTILVVLCARYKTSPNKSASPNNRPPSQCPSSSEVQAPDSLRTSFPGGCG